MSPKKQKTAAIPKLFTSAAATTLARNALMEVAAEAQIGELIGHTQVSDQIVNVLFECLHPGYPHWSWCATLTSVDKKTVTVIEVQMTPEKDALLAPDWVPWEDRLEEYRAEQEAERLAKAQEKADAKQQAQAEAEALRNSGGGDENDDENDDDLERWRDDDQNDEHDDDEDNILDSHFDHELRGELPKQLDDIVDEIELDDPNPL